MQFTIERLVRLHKKSRRAEIRESGGRGYADGRDEFAPATTALKVMARIDPSLDSQNLKFHAPIIPADAGRIQRPDVILQAARSIESPLGQLSRSTTPKSRNQHAQHLQNLLKDTCRNCREINTPFFAANEGVKTTHIFGSYATGLTHDIRARHPHVP